MRLLQVGSGAEEILGRSRAGVVHSVFGRALYLALDGGLVAVTAPDVLPGPLHLRAARLAGHRRGEEVRVSAAALAVGPVTYDRQAPVWHRPLPSAAAVHAGRATVLRATHQLPEPELDLGVGRAEGENRWRTTALTDSLRDGRLDAVRRLVSGRGPGLTPAGDDLLAGVLVFAAALWGDSARDELAAAADGRATGDVAAAFLAWAARGSSIEPVHDLVDAAARRDEAGARSAVTALGRIGASSGWDLAFGLRLAARWLPRTPPGQELAGECTQSSRAGRLPGLFQDNGRLART